MTSIRETLDTISAQRKRVLIVGLGISGVESARFLRSRRLRVSVIEKLSQERFMATSKFSTEVSSLRELGIEIHFGVDGERIAPLLMDVGLVVVSPGVSLESAVIGSIKRLGVPFIAEMELGVQLHHGRVIVVTGSNGKSTTSSLIDHILRRGGCASHLCGNIGVPVIAQETLLREVGAQAPVLVVEASSYQLEACSVLKPSISVVLNISENHLERHGSLERYAAAKAKALRLQDGDDLSVINADDPMVVEMARGTRSQRAVFGARSVDELRKMSSTWAHISNGAEGRGTITVSRNGDEEEYRTDSVKLLGAHNRYNISAAILVARHLGVEREAIQRGLESFEPLEHRLEVIWRGGARTIINDSKSTTVAATVAALTTVVDTFPDSPVMLMIGGLSKAGSWQPLLKEVMRHRARGVSVICFGKDGALLASHCKSSGVEHSIASNLRAATRLALERGARGGVVLLSPGCASFDEFVDFEHRGREFKRYVNEDGPAIMDIAL